MSLEEPDHMELQLSNIESAVWLILMVNIVIGIGIVFTSIYLFKIVKIMENLINHGI